MMDGRRDHTAGAQGDRHSDMHVHARLESVVHHEAVHLGDLGHRERGRLDEQGRHDQASTDGALGVRLLQPGDGVAKVDVGAQVVVGDLAVDRAIKAPMALRIAACRASAPVAAVVAAGLALSGAQSLPGPPSDGGVHRRLEMSPTAHVLLDDGAAGPRSPDGADLDAELRRHPTCQRR